LKKEAQFPVSTHEFNLRKRRRGRKEEKKRTKKDPLTMAKERRREKKREEERRRKTRSIVFSLFIYCTNTSREGEFRHH